MTSARLASLGRTALPILAALTFMVGVVPTLAVAGKTLGFDFLAYHLAAARVLTDRPLYDMSFTQIVGFGLFYYPPTFAPFVLALGLLPASIATWIWVVAMIAAFVVGTAILPVSRTVRWWIVLLAGLSFPFVYAIKLGQVGPLLFLTFAMGWRWLDAPGRLGTSAAIGAAVKLQPALILVWALLTRRWRAAVIGIVVLAALALVATLLAGAESWTDFATLVRTVADPITTPHNFTPGAVAYQLGVPAPTAFLVQLASTVTAVGIFLAVIRWCTAEASYLGAVIVSQLVSPVLWDHYAMLLLLPVAYLLSAGRWWALVIPLATAWPLVGITPAVVYPLVFWLTLMAVAIVGRRTRPGAIPA